MSRLGHNLPNTSGWVAFSRKMREHSLVGMGQQVKPQDPRNRFTASRMEAWIDLIWMAAYQETETVVKGHKVLLVRGDLIASRSFLAKRWNWTQMIVRTFLNNLEKEGMITKDRTGKGEHPNLIRVCNYDLYQVAASGFYANEANNQADNKLSDCNKNIICDGQLTKQPSSNQANNQANNQLNSQANNQAGFELSDCKVTDNLQVSDIKQPSKQPYKKPAKQPSKQPQNINNNKQDKNINTSYLLKSEQPKVSKSNSGPKKTAHRLPDDWQPSEKDWMWCQKNLILTQQQAVFETEAFRDYFHSCGTANARKLDWSLAWKNWLRKVNKDEERQQNYKKQADQRYSNRVNGGRISGKAIPGM